MQAHYDHILVIVLEHLGESGKHLGEVGIFFISVG